MIEATKKENGEYKRKKVTPFIKKGKNTKKYLVY